MKFGVCCLPLSNDKFDMRRRRFLSVVIGSLGLAGCVGDDASPTGSSSPTPTETATSSPSPTPTATATQTAMDGADVTVELISTAFSPVRAEAAVGDTVQWVNKDSYGHDVTATSFHDKAVDWSFQTDLSGGEQATYTFDEAGVYEYYCSIHGKGTMCGAILVGDVSLEQNMPCETGGDY